MKDDQDCTAARLVYRIDCKLCPGPSSSMNEFGTGTVDQNTSQVSMCGSGSSSVPLCGSGSSPTAIHSYAGTSGHNGHKRLMEHAASVFRMDKSSALSKHHLDNHPEIKFNNPEEVRNLFDGSVIKSGIRFNPQRYITEAIKIQEFNNDPSVSIMNNKSEWGNNRVRRLRNG